jgi:hypothetical protein
VTRKILACLDLPARAPPLESARVESDGHESESRDNDPLWTVDQRRIDDDMA